jgi:DNA-binding NarL/FixJ family response regulator
VAAVIRLLLVDDDPLVRAGLALILGGGQDLEIVGEAADGEEALTRVREVSPDVVLMDIRMPRLDGIEATARLLSQPQPPKVVVLTTFDTDDDVVQALAAGASGFLLKDTPPADIVEAVKKVAAGDPILSPKVTSQLIRQVTEGTVDDRAASARRRLDTLTPREREVAIAVATGLSNAEISARLHLSVPTVKAHVSRLFTKLSAQNRVQIAICVHDAGLV